jgi:hypothetical protein
VRICFESVDNARDAVFDENHVEVDEQAEALVGEPANSYAKTVS